uniref:Wall-associated receptor kinase galacturonan-binding domain-containing protein n=1 Tax=Nelumbo nucifera TaxID=4432 RepID=A0A822Z3T9_NELNU|nr:TPA_asm: hypothetical protein HUJ06_013790 [Nelumbo nucifera]
MPTSLETRPGCRNKCGNVSIPYPFGLVGDDSTCYRDEFKLFCNTATDPPNLTIYGDSLYSHSILNISLQGQLTFSRKAATSCYMGENQDQQGIASTIELPNSPTPGTNSRQLVVTHLASCLTPMTKTSTEVNGSSCEELDVARRQYHMILAHLI